MYSLTITSDEGDIVQEYPLSAEAAIKLLGYTLNASVREAAEEEEDEPETVAAPRVAKKKGKNKCSICGKAGHSKPTCPQNVNRIPVASTPDAEKAPEPLTQDQFDALK